MSEIRNTIQKWCYTDAQYNEAMALQRSYDERDPKHEKLPHIMVVDCRTQR